MKDPCTSDLPLKGRNRILACYVVSLIQGDTIIGVCIHHTMVMGYIKQATSLHEDCGLAHRKLVDLGYIKIMTDTVKKFETVPKQYEMISNSIFH